MGRRGLGMQGWGVGREWGKRYGDCTHTMVNCGIESIKINKKSTDVNGNTTKKKMDGICSAITSVWYTVKGSSYWKYPLRRKKRGGGSECEYNLGHGTKLTIIRDVTAGVVLWKT